MTNNNNGGNTVETYSSVRFALGATGTVFTSKPAAPAGWYVSSYTSTAVIFKVITAGTGIALGQSVTFSLTLAMGASAADAPESFAAIQGYYTNKKRISASSFGLWTRKSLAITAFQITDTSGNPVSAIVSGVSFQLRMTVKNNSSIAQTTVVSNPPTANKTGIVTQGLTSTTGSPLNLAAGASGTIIFTYSTALIDSGTISFTATAQNGATVTSILATSGTLVVSSFTASIVVSPTCQYAGANITVTMTVTNGSTVFTATNVTPTLTPVAGAPVTAVSGPTPASIASIGVSSSGVFTWVYQVNSNATVLTNPFSFTGSATGTRNASTVTSPTSTSTPNTTTRGSFPVIVNPVATNAGSTNAEQTFTVTNSGCAAVNSVGITFPAGWTWANDAYSLVNLSAASAIETWAASGTNPVTYTAPNVAGQIPLTFSGDFSLVFSATPPVATTSVFTVRVTDTIGAFVDVVPVTPVTVNAFKTGTLNNAANKNWREDFK